MYYTIVYYYVYYITLWYYGFRCHGDLLYNYITRLDQTRIYLSAI